MSKRIWKMNFYELLNFYMKKSGKGISIRYHKVNGYIRHTLRKVRLLWTGSLQDLNFNTSYRAPFTKETNETINAALTKTPH